MSSTGFRLPRPRRPGARRAGNLRVSDVLITSAAVLVIGGGVVHWSRGGSWVCVLPAAVLVIFPVLASLAGWAWELGETRQRRIAAKESTDALKEMAERPTVGPASAPEMRRAEDLLSAALEAGALEDPILRLRLIDVIARQGPLRGALARVVAERTRRGHLAVLGALGELAGIDDPEDLAVTLAWLARHDEGRARVAGGRLRQRLAADARAHVLALVERRAPALSARELALLRELLAAGPSKDAAPDKTTGTG